MGCFGYICKGCGTPINGNCHTGGEKCIMIHVRHGKELGRTEGHYDEYGRVVEDKVFRNDDDNNINGHKEICKSEFHLEDSYHQDMRLYKKKRVTPMEYVKMRVQSELGTHNYCINTTSFLYDWVDYPRYLEIYKDYLMRKQMDDTNGLIMFREMLKNFVLTCIMQNKDAKAFFWREFNKLPTVEGSKFSGLVAWHSACYKKASAEERADLKPSELDPNQSWGKVRKIYE